MMQKVLIIVGPTASGKSALAVELAKRFDGEVVSADSRQVYKGLDIGTGKVTEREMSGVPHHLLDVASPKRQFSADDFKRLSSSAIAGIAKRGKLPIVAGGTGFYIDALVGRMTLPDVPPNPALRDELGAFPAEELFSRLRKKDPARAEAMRTPSERNNKARLIRALEIAGALGASPLPASSDAYDALWIGIAPPFEALEKKIALRLEARLGEGMIAEAERLHAAGLSYLRMKELGLEYGSLAKFLRGKLSRPELEQEILIGNRRYAKRQLAYWKRNDKIEWHLPTQTRDIMSRVAKWLQA